MLYEDTEDMEYKIYQSYRNYEFEIKKWDIPLSSPIDKNDDRIFLDCSLQKSNFVILTIFKKLSGLKIYKLDLK